MSYFPPPPIAETQIFSRLPDRYRRRGACAWGEANRPHFETDSFLEGPAFDAEGRLYVTDIPYGRVFRVGEGDDWELVAEYDGWPNGLKFDRDGAAVIADYKHGLMRLDVASGKVDPLLTSAGSEGFKGVNDLAFGPDGTIYFTDQGQTGMHDPTGRVYALEPSGAEVVRCAPGAVEGLVMGCISSRKPSSGAARDAAEARPSQARALNPTLARTFCGNRYRLARETPTGNHSSLGQPNQSLLGSGSEKLFSPEASDYADCTSGQPSSNERSSQLKDS